MANGKKNGKNTDVDPNIEFIPEEICFLMEISLLSLVGSEKFEKQFCGEAIFSRIRTKFNNAILNKKVRNYFINHVFQSFSLTVLFQIC